MNEWLCQSLDRTRSELLTQRLADITAQADLPKLDAARDALLRGGQPEAAIAIRHLRRDGSSCRLHDRLSLIRDERGTPASLLWLAIDPSQPLDDSGGI